MLTDNRRQIKSLLEKWGKGLIDEIQVHQQAEEWWELLEEKEYQMNQPLSIEVEILSNLEILNHQLITTSDIPAMLKFLETPLGNELEGWANWKAYMNSVNWVERGHELKDNQYYCT